LPNEFYKANQLELRPKKGEKAKENFLGQLTSNKAGFLKFDLKMGNLATMYDCPLHLLKFNLQSPCKYRVYSMVDRGLQIFFS